MELRPRTSTSSSWLVHQSGSVSDAVRCPSSSSSCTAYGEVRTAVSAVARQAQRPRDVPKPWPPAAVSNTDRTIVPPSTDSAAAPHTRRACGGAPRRIRAKQDRLAHPRGVTPPCERASATRGCPCPSTQYEAALEKHLPYLAAAAQCGRLPFGSRGLARCSSVSVSVSVCIGAASRRRSVPRLYESV